MFRALLIVYSVVLVLLSWGRGEGEESMITAPDSSDNVIDRGIDESKSSELAIANEISNAVQAIVPATTAAEPTGRDGRSLCKKKKKKGKHRQNKYVIPLLFGWLLIKSIIIPVALKGLALLSGGSFMLSLLSLVLTAIMGLRRLIAGFSLPTVFSTGPTGYSKYKRKDMIEDDNPYDHADPYKYYRDKYDNSRR